MEPPEASETSNFELEHLVGTVFAGRYDVLRLVSEGSSIALYDVTDNETGRAVTLKLVRPRLAAAPSFRERFDERMRAVSTLSHPNIAAVYDWGVAPVGTVSTAYVIVEQLTGGSLRDMFDRGRRLSPSQALTIGLDACRALDYAHRRGFVHSELTPSKLVFGDDRRLRVVDFGLARLLGERDWANPEGVATHVAWYSAPEQGQGAMVDGSLDGPLGGRIDVYALALVLHEAVTGTLPFKSDSTVATLGLRSGRLMPVSADLGPLASVLERAGRPDPAERASAAEFGKALVAAASKLPRPEPLPLFATGLFDVAPDELRLPDDPTGGVRRKPADRQTDPDAPTELLVVPIDEPDPVVEPPAPVVESVDDTAQTVGAPPTQPVAQPAVEPAGGRTGIDLAAGAVPAATPDAGDLVILPLDTGIDDRPAVAPGPVRHTPPTAVLPVVEPRPTRRFPWKILGGLIVIAALVTLGVLATRLFRTPSYVVPPLAGLPEAEARNLIAPNGWVLDKDTEFSDEFPEQGTVIRTAPGAGTELAEGEPFLIVVSDGPTPRPLPDSTGLPLDAALIALQDLDLVAEPTEEYHEVVPAGTVIRWSVPADLTLTTGSKVLPGTVVALVVSEGPAPRTVPELVGVAVEGARTVVESRQLRFVVAEEQEFSDDIAAGSVMWQSIEPGTEVPRDSEITVVVSKGPDVIEFPDISGADSFLEARDILEEAGFTVELTFGDDEGPVQSYEIDGETPEVGSVHRRGTLVEFEAFDDA